MEVQKAIEWQKAFKKTYNGIPEEVNEACDTAIKALEKQIPEPVLYEGDGYADGVMVYDMAYCPACDHDFEEGCTEWKSKFCPNCGQALDWSGAQEGEVIL